jgi:hypothetical protein
VIQPDQEWQFSAERAERGYRRQIQFWRDIFAARGTEQTFNVDEWEEDEEDEPADERGGRWISLDDDDEQRDQPTANELLPALPQSMVSFASALLPGWMNRGNNHASFLFDKIGVKASDLFETPEALFAPLVKQAPVMAEALSSTISGNFELGGYVPPQKVAAFVERLEKHKIALSTAWGEGATELSPDYIKIIEPARYALKHGYGYLEAAEVYSGPLGMMN